MAAKSSAFETTGLGDIRVKGDVVSTDKFLILANNIVGERGFVRFWFTSRASGQEMAGYAQFMVSRYLWAK